MIQIGQGAEFSPDKLYRYALWRIWDVTKPLVMFIGLNPSIANEKKDDPTIRRLGGKDGMAYRNGYGGFYMMNLFPFVTSYPSQLQTDLESKIINDEWLQKINLLCETVVFCWGNFKCAERAGEIIKMFPAAMCFGKNANGSPKHPLYLKADTKLINYIL
jgi:hypothetical protein